MLIFPPTEMSVLSDPGLLTKLLNETVFGVVTLFSFGYYRIYADGASNQRLFLFLGGLSKLGAACILVSWYLQGHATWLLILLGVMPEIGFGSYFLAVWWGLRRLEADQPPSSLSVMTAPDRTGPTNWVFGVAAAHLILLAAPSFVLSITGNTLDMDAGMKLLLDDESLELVSAPGLTRDVFRMFNWLLLCVGLGYARIYSEGATRQPLLVVVGAVGKLGVGSLFLLSRYGSRIEFLILAIIPDLVLGSYFFKVWVDVGSIFAPPKANAKQT